MRRAWFGFCVRRFSQLTFGVKRLDVFFIKATLTAFFFKLANGGKTVDGVADETRHGLAYDEVYFAVECVSDHAFEAFEPSQSRERVVLSFLPRRSMRKPGAGSK